jgi:large subunit ribosomal protein L3
MRSSGHMGDVRITIKGLTVARVDVENTWLLVRGAVARTSGSVVIVKKAQGKRYSYEFRFRSFEFVSKQTCN